MKLLLFLNKIVQQPARRVHGRSDLRHGHSDLSILATISMNLAQYAAHGAFGASGPCKEDGRG